MEGFGFKGGGAGGPGGAAKISNPITATLNVGGILIGFNFPAGTTIEAILDALIQPYIVPSMSSLATILNPNDPFIEVGRTVDVISASWSVANGSDGNPPQNMFITGDGFNKTVTGLFSAANPLSTTQLLIAGSKTWTLSGEDKNSNPITPVNYSREWRFKYWFGATNAADPINDGTATALALALQQSQFLNSKAANFTCTADNDTTGNFTWIFTLQVLGR